jgi:hypothetical protein
MACSRHCGYYSRCSDVRKWAPNDYSCWSALLQEPNTPARSGLVSIVDAAPSASTFVLPRGGSNLTFSINVDKNSNDIYFRLVANADNSWVAVGAGSEMKDTLMFVAYQAKDSKGVFLGECAP